MTIAFADTSKGYRRCIGAAHRDPFAENEPQTRLRLLGAAFIQALEEAIPESDHPDWAYATDLAKRAKDDVENGVMLGVKALYEAPVSQPADSAS